MLTKCRSLSLHGNAALKDNKPLDICKGVHMLYVYNKQKKLLEQCKETQFRSHGLLERQDLAKWIEQYPIILGEDLLIITSEYDRFDKTSERLDFLGVDKECNLVVIEIKLDDSGKNVDLQAIKYAAYCSTLRFIDIVDMYIKYQKQKGVIFTIESAKQTILEFLDNSDFEELNDRPRIILVAKEFRPEVTASVLWLRKFGIDISCVKWDPYELSEEYMAINSSVLIPLPEAKDYVIQVEKKEIAEHSNTLTQQEYKQFWSGCIDSLNKRLPRDYPAPSAKYYYKIPTDISGVHFEWSFHGRPRSSFGVELHFEKGNKELNQALLATFANLKDHLQDAIKESVIFQEDWGKIWSRLYIEKQQGKMTNELRDWAVEKMQIMIEILEPELEKIKT